MPEVQLATEATAKVLEEKIKARTARVGVVGLGYVGLPLAVEFAKAGFHVTGIDISEEKARRVTHPGPLAGIARGSEARTELIWKLLALNSAVQGCDAVWRPESLTSGPLSVSSP